MIVSSENILKFKGLFTGEMNLDEVVMVCVPSKEKYSEVDLCFKAVDNSINYCVAQIDCNSLSFEEKKKLGYKIQDRWNVENQKDFENNQDLLKELQKTMRHAEKLAYEYFKNCEVGLEREQAGVRYENIRTAMRVL